MNRNEQYMNIENIESHIDKKMFEVTRELDELLEKISDSIQHEMVVRKEVVFLPYKASMWDSRESVWKAADKDCDTYVIPLPYFDRTKEGAFGELHYEEDLYPKYVPVTAKFVFYDVYSQGNGENE